MSMSTCGTVNQSTTGWIHYRLHGQVYRYILRWLVSGQVCRYVLWWLINDQVARCTGMYCDDSLRSQATCYCGTVLHTVSNIVEDCPLCMWTVEYTPLMPTQLNCHRGPMYPCGILSCCIKNIDHFQKICFMSPAPNNGVPLTQLEKSWTGKARSPRKNVLGLLLWVAWGCVPFWTPDQSSDGSLLQYSSIKTFTPGLTMCCRF